MILTKESIGLFAVALSYAIARPSYKQRVCPSVTRR